MMVFGQGSDFSYESIWPNCGDTGGNFEIGFETPGAKKKFLGQAWYAYYDLLCTSLTRFNYKRKLGLLQGKLTLRQCANLITTLFTTGQ